MNIVDDFKEGTLTGISKAVIDIGHFFKDLAPACENCTAVGPDFEKMEEFFSLVANPL